ncbi:MAG: HAMP domain-containing protein [Magnetococcales bacterium]|nr:HAMP domain-containing protein [Magnetococcales bacterium]MBF0150860.1 HAMP domain-containing protein [Magnetococcales bacterium]MBF0173855.1 HAMP domain-containing protein [Magnetococcales bacterium]MBF0347007.1 HAMP domain-containing protein [Magnetococcales bacterium]MBF0631327.1 HAMP domain-containing protein [Magnetococcales bacterium]
MNAFSEKGKKRWIWSLLLLAVIAITMVTAQGLRGSATVAGEYSLFFLLLLYLNLFLALVLGVLVFRKVFRLWQDRYQHRAGSKLRLRMVSMFVLLSLLPTLVIAILSLNFLNRGVDSWFSDRISLALESSLDVARAYYHENQRTVRHDAEAIVRNRRITSSLSLGGTEAAVAQLEIERQARGLDEISILRADGTRLAWAGELPFDPIPDLSSLNEGSSKALMITNDAGDRVRAFVPLGEGLFISTGHWIDRQVLGQMETMESTYTHYKKLRETHELLKANHTVTLVLITMLLLLAAIWSGFGIANSLTDPITDLVIGTRKVAQGDLSVNLAISGDDELATLMTAFNAMTRKLSENHEELQNTNALLEERRRFMAAIVHNISSGVISVDQYHKVTLMNPTAAKLLSVDPVAAIGRPLEAVMPEAFLGPLQTFLKEQKDRSSPPPPPVPGEPSHPGIQIAIQGENKPMTLLTRITLLEDNLGGSRGFITTFDDITEVLVAQRTSAWSEVARRIAHEIKNPLTPIQLWAQRIRRKYMKTAEHPEIDLRVLDEGTTTIIQQVEELRVLVNEFSTFSRLPRPRLHDHDIHTSIREALILHAEALASVEVRTDFDERLPKIPHDPGQIKQVVTNLITNAIAATREHSSQPVLAISTRLLENSERMVLEVADNGMGIPTQDRDRVFEPYFTTKKKGTGLGLAIVKKIIEDHGGTIRLKDSELRGALVEIKLPLNHDLQETRHTAPSEAFATRPAT